MLLQLAIDQPQGFAVLSQVHELVDIVEIGTPMLMRFGLSAITTARELAPQVPLLADTKIVDGGAAQAKMVFAAGATFMTVLSAASATTLSATSEIAESEGGYIVMDTIGDGGDWLAKGGMLPDRCSLVAIHSSTDGGVSGTANCLERSLSAVRRLHKLGYRVALAGGIDKTTVDAAVRAAPEIVVIGRAITCDSDPRGTTEWMLTRLSRRGHGWPWETK